MLKYSDFSLTICERCESLVFRGWWGGFDLRLDRLTVPLAHAMILERYGKREVVVLRRSISNRGKLVGQEFSFRAEIEHHRNGERRWYGINHVCGTRHDKRGSGR